MICRLLQRMEKGFELLISFERLLWDAVCGRARKEIP